MSKNTVSYETYHWYKDHGICVDCKEVEAAPGKTRCLNCLSIRAEKRREKDSKLTEEERAEINRIKREKSQKLRDYRKANGLCDICGKPVYKNYSKCYEHYLYHKRVTRQRNEAKKKGYAEIGLCRICGKPTAEGKKFCAEHLKQYREHMGRTQAIRMEKLRNAQ